MAFHQSQNHLTDRGTEPCIQDIGNVIRFLTDMVI